MYGWTRTSMNIWNVRIVTTTTLGTSGYVIYQKKEKESEYGLLQAVFVCSFLYQLSK